jgi:hypothetical protein
MFMINSILNYTLSTVVVHCISLRKWFHKISVTLYNVLYRSQRKRSGSFLKDQNFRQNKALLLYATQVLGVRGCIASTNS